ncbi:MAG: hypothetical protein WCQ50_21250 [Spirochaetota bacterium]
MVPDAVGDGVSRETGEGLAGLASSGLGRGHSLGGISPLIDFPFDSAVNLPARRVRVGKVPTLRPRQAITLAAARKGSGRAARIAAISASSGI